MSVINTNVASLNAQRNLSTSSAGLATSLQRLSSGLRINSAKDDAAGMAISERMTSQIRGSSQAARNANDGISLAQTAEGDLSSISNNLQRMRELSVQASNASNSDSDRAALQTEVTALKSEIDRVAKNSSFNGVKLLDGSFNAQTFQIGANNTANDKLTIDKIANANTSKLGGTSVKFSAEYTSTVALGATAFAEGDLTINGQTVGASVAGAEAGNTADSATAKAAAINAISGKTGVFATAQATTVSATVAGAGNFDVFTAIAPADSFSINGVDVGGIAAASSGAGKGANLAAAINKISEQTGVSATADIRTGQVSLTAKDGRNIELVANKTQADNTSATAAVAALKASTGLTIGKGAITAGNVAPAAEVTRGAIKFTSESDKGIVIDGSAAGLTKAGAAAKQDIVSTRQVMTDSIESVDITTAKGASNALSAIDGALKSINDSRSNLGAVQNRFSSVVSSLQTTTENLSASRSRITDTDFASETANMTRSQILQQAGTAMLAQANQLPNSVMSLLRG